MSRIPETPSPMEEEGIPETDQDYGFEPPRDAPLMSDEFGTTAAEMHDGEPLDGRIAREEPDVIDLVNVDADESAPPVGRLVESDEGARTDTEAEMVAADVGTDLGGYSAEEAAMHLEPEV
ncbi:MAG: hypothetical protein QOE05_2357 [Actinomycetota bacterium]|jgi:hypothetical protein|nr:hypothetical protein [Actinomycetota bacterium]